MRAARAPLEGLPMLRRLVVLLVLLVSTPALGQQLRGAPDARLGASLTWLDHQVVVGAPGANRVYIIDPGAVPADASIDRFEPPTLRGPHDATIGAQLVTLEDRERGPLLAVVRSRHDATWVDLFVLDRLGDDYRSSVAASILIDDLPADCHCLSIHAIDDLDGDGRSDLAIDRSDLGQRLFVLAPPLDGDVHDALLLEVDAIDSEDTRSDPEDFVVTERDGIRAIGLPAAEDDAGLLLIEAVSTDAADTHADSTSEGDKDDKDDMDGPPDGASHHAALDLDRNAVRLSDAQLASANPGATTVSTLHTSADAQETLDGDGIAALLATAAGQEIVVDGRLRHSVPLDVPGGRGAFAPSLAISFTNGRPDPWLGQHWSLSGLSRVDRRGPLGGSPTGDDALDTFTLDGQRLIEHSWQTGTLRSFRTEQASPRIVRFDTGTNLWTVTGGGVTRTLGDAGTHGAVQDGPGTATAAPFTHRWWLARDEDDHGNPIVFVYEAAHLTGGIRPVRVAWGTDHIGAPALLAPDDFNFALTFSWDGPPLLDAKAQAGAVSLVPNALSAMTLLGSPSPGAAPFTRLSSWELTYTALQPTTLPALSTITLRAAADPSDPAGPTLPLRTFHYRDDDGALALGPIEGLTAIDRHGNASPFSDPGVAGAGQVVRFVSLNHDALPDALVFDIDAEWTTGRPPVCDPDGCPHIPGAVPCSPTNNVVCISPGSSRWYAVCQTPVSVRAFVNTGDLSFVEDAMAANVVRSWLNAQGEPRSGLDDMLGRVRLVDVNGDGMADLLGPESSYLSVSNADWHHAAPPAQPGIDGLTGAQLVDLNGDGRPELVTAPTDRTEEILPGASTDGGLCAVPPRNGAGFAGIGHPAWTVQWNRTEGQSLAFTGEEPLDGMPFFGGAYTEGLSHSFMDPPVAPLMATPGQRPTCTAFGRAGTLFDTDLLQGIDHELSGLFAAGSGWSWMAQHQRFADVNADGCVDVTMSMDAEPLFLNGAGAIGAGVNADLSYGEVFYGDCVGGFEPAAPNSAQGAANLGWPSLVVRATTKVDVDVSCASLPFNGLRLSRSCDAEESVQPWVHARCEPEPSAICCGNTTTRTECSGMYAVCEHFDCATDTYGDDGNGPGWGAWSDDLEFYATVAHPVVGDSPLFGSEPWDPRLRHLWALGLQERRPGPSATPTPGGFFQDLDGDGVPELLQTCLGEGDPLVAYARRSVWDNGVQDDLSCTGARAVSMGGVSWLGQLTDRGESAPRADLTRMANRASRLGPDRASIVMDLDGDGFADHLTVDAGTWSVRRNQRRVGAGRLAQIEYPTGGRSTLVWRSGDPLANPLLPFAERGIVEVVDGSGHRVFGRAGCRIDGSFTGCQTVVEQSHRGAVRQTRHATRAEAPGLGWMSATWSASGQLEGVQISLPADPQRTGIDTVAPYAHSAWRSCGIALGEGSHDPSLSSPQHWCLSAPNDALAGPSSGMAHHNDLVGQPVFSFPRHAGLLGATVAVPGFVPQTGGALADNRIRVVEEESAGEPWLQTLTRWERGEVSTPDDDLRTSLSHAVDPLQGPIVDSTRTEAPATGLLVERTFIASIRQTPVGTTRVDAAGDAISRTSQLDAFGRTWRSIDPENNASEVQFDWCGGIAGTQDPLGNTTTHTVDAQCRAAGSTASNGLVVDSTPGGFGPLASWTFPDGGQPPLGRFQFDDRDPQHVGDPVFPQAARSDGRTASFTWVDRRGRPIRSGSCALGGPLPAPFTAVPGDVLALCAPGTRVQADALWSDDGLLVARSAVYAPSLSGAPEQQVWSRSALDSLGRVVETATVRGLAGAVAAGGGITLTATQHLRFLDGAGALGPDGVLRRTIVDPLMERVLRGGQVVARTERRADGAVVAAFDAAARQTAFSYDGFGRLQATSTPPFQGVDGGVITLVAPTGSVQRSASGRIERAWDPAGAEWSTTHDALGRPTEVWDPESSVTLTTFDDPQRRAVTSSPERADVLVLSDALGRPVIQETAGLAAEVQYDPFGGVLLSQDAAGRIVSQGIAWLPGGIVRTSATDAAGTSWRFSGPDGRVLRAVDADGVAVDTVHDEWGRPMETRIGPTDPLDISSHGAGDLLVTQGYDALSRPAWSCPGGRFSGELCTATTYDALGRVEAEYHGVDPADVQVPAAGAFRGVTTFTWTADDALDTVTDPLGRLTELVYDAAGQLHEVWVEGVLQRRTWHDVMGRPARTEDAAGQVSTTTYDTRGLVEAVSVPGLPTQTFGYRGDGSLLWSEDGDGHANGAFPVPADRWFDYDAVGRLITVTERNGLRRETGYTGPDPTISQLRDERGVVLARSELSLDAAGRVIGAASALTDGCATAADQAGLMVDVCAPSEVALVKMGWTAAGRRAALSDPNGQTTSWGYAPGTGRLETIASATLLESLRWDPLGRLKSSERGPVWGAPELTLEHDYDVLGQLERQTWTDAAGTTEEVGYGYDVVGRQVWTESRRDGQPIVEEMTDWDAWDRPLQVGRNLFGQSTANPQNGACDPGEVCLRYDDLGRPEAITYPDGRDVYLEWSAQGLDRACTAQGCAMNQPIYQVAQRDAMGRPEEEWLSGGVQRMTSYDADGRQVTTDTDFTGDWVSVSQEFDLLGRLVSRETQQLGQLALGDVGGTEAWTYNAAGWLVGEELDGEPYTQTHDAGGNRTSRTNSEGLGWTASYGPDNRLESWDDGGGKVPLAYDGLGRRTNDVDGRSFTYTPRGRVERASVGGSQVAAYAYGPDGRRAWEATSAGSRDYVYGPGAWLPYTVNTAAGPEDHVLVGGALLGLLGDPGAGNPSGGNSSAVLDDGTGTPLFRSGTTGAVDHQRRWDAYGSPITTGGSALSTTWKQLLPSGPDVGLLAAGARDYDPSTGTWMQPDPMGVDGGVNVYRYAEGDPVNRSDPSGYCIDAETPEWLMEQQREHAEYQLYSRMWAGQTDEVGGWRRGGDLPPAIARGSCFMGAGGTCGSMTATIREPETVRMREAHRRGLAMNGLGLDEGDLDALKGQDRDRYDSLLQDTERLYRALGRAVHFQRLADGMGSLGGGLAFRNGDSPMFASADDSALVWLAHRQGRATSVEFTTPVFVFATPRARGTERMLAAFGGHEAIIDDLERRRSLRRGDLVEGQYGEVTVLNFEENTQVRPLDADVAQAIAVAGGDLPMPTDGVRSVIRNMAQVWDWEVNGGSYDSRTLLGGTGYGVFGLGIQLLGDAAQTQFGPLAGLVGDLALDVWLTEGHRNTGMPPEDQMIAATVISEVGLGLVGGVLEAYASARAAGRAVAASGPAGGPGAGSQVRGIVPSGAAQDIAGVTQSLDETGRLPAEYSRRGAVPGGMRWRNRSGDIEGAVGTLREADVGDIRVGSGGSRGEQRAVYDEAGNVWFTPDHYESWIPIRIGRAGQ